MKSTRTQTSLFDASEIETHQREKTDSQSISTQGKSEPTLGKEREIVANVIGNISMGKTIHYVSKGEWSMHDLLFHILSQTGPAHVTFSTWSMSEIAVRQMIDAVESGLLLSLAAALDWRVKVRRPEVLELVRFNFENIRLVNCHAKVAVVQNYKWSVVIVGSANFTNNPRIEAGVITCDKAIADFHKEWIQHEINNGSLFSEEKKNGRKKAKRN